MDEDITEKAEVYAAARGRHLAGQLGFGIHGSVFVLEGNVDTGASALKIHNWEESYLRERDVYDWLREDLITSARGLHIPVLIGRNDELLALEMTIVKPPFLLDFASAHLDRAPEFSEEIWEEWHEKNREQFGEDWPMVQAILAKLEGMGIYMLDPSPSNIRFR